VFLVYVAFIELTRYLPSPASRPEFGPAMRQVLIGLLIILTLKFRPEGIFPERPGGRQKRRWLPARGTPAVDATGPAATAGGAAAAGNPPGQPAADPAGRDGSAR
jgi:hypothetical protein